MRWATWLACRTTSVRWTIRSVCTRASSMMPAALRWVSARKSSRSFSIHRAWRISSGMRSSAPSSSSTSSSRSTRTDEESGIGLAVSTMSSALRR